MALTNHEESVSKFYSHIVDFKHDYNEGFLTFGLWKTKSGESIPPPLSYKSMYDELLDGRTIKPRHNVLEVACGQGAGMLRIQSRYGCKIQGLDISTGNVQLAKRRLRNTGIAVTHGSATRMPYNDNFFDSIICVEGGPHFETREYFFKEAYRVLKPGGRLFMADVVPCYSFKEYSFIQKMFLKLTAWSWVCPPENLEYGIEGYKEKIKEHGFKTTRFDVIGDRVIPGYCSHNLTLSVMSRQAMVRGAFIGFLGGPLIDTALSLGYYFEIFDYVIVEAEKPLKK